MILSNPSWFLIKSSLADVYYELDYKQNKARQTLNVEYLDKAKELVKLEIKQLRAHSRQLRHFRRMLLSLTKIEIRQGWFNIAKNLIKELLAIYNRLTKLNAINQVGYVCALIA